MGPSRLIERFTITARPEQGGTSFFQAVGVAKRAPLWRPAAMHEQPEQDDDGKGERRATDDPPATNVVSACPDRPGGLSVTDGGIKIAGREGLPGSHDVGTWVRAQHADRGNGPRICRLGQQNLVEDIDDRLFGDGFRSRCANA